jgi:Uma2 family endonuclease
MAVGTLVPIEEYLSSTYHPDREYIEGELLDRNMGEFDHSGLQALITHSLMGRRKELGIHVYTELRVQVSSRRFRIPDISVTTQRGKGRILREPPLLCIEILSPEDRAIRMEDKIDDYLRFGVRYIWLIDPREKKCWAYGKNGMRESVTVLTTENPRIELPVDELFAELEDEIDLGNN